MPSAFTHLAVAGALGLALRPAGEVPTRYWVLGALCAAGPDLDVIGLRAGIPYEHVLGHRGLTHSLPFAAAAAAALVALAFRDDRWRSERRWLWLYLFVAGASHGLLDMLTNGGHGVALFAPFDTARYFFPVTPIPVSPLSVSAFVGQRGATILAHEFLWVGLPALALAALSVAWRRRSAPDA